MNRFVKALTNSAAYRAYDRAVRRFDPFSIEFHVNEYSRAHQRAICIQVGANLLFQDTIDFLITDVEGHDIAILDSFPLERVRPANIVFELPVRRDASLDRIQLNCGNTAT